MIKESTIIIKEKQRSIIKENKVKLLKTKFNTIRCMDQYIQMKQINSKQDILIIIKIFKNIIEK